jgi:hypothetical protein
LKITEFIFAPLISTIDERSDEKNRGDAVWDFKMPKKGEKNP